MGRGEVAREAPVEAHLQGYAGLSAAAMARSASARFMAIGFSTKTALPASAAATTRSAWAVLAQVMATASTRGSSMSACGSVEPVDPERLTEAFGSGRLRVGDGDELGLAEAARQGGGVVGPDAAGSDEPEPDGVDARHDCSFADLD